jgi:hypothetical protein
VIDIHAEGVGVISRHLESIASRAVNPKPAFEEITDRLIEAERRLFSSDARRDPLRRSTIQRKARSQDANTRRNAREPLVATGALERFLTTKGPDAQPVTLSNVELVFGVPGGRSDFHYARYQAKHGRNPLASKTVVRAAARPVLEAYLSPDA